MKIYIMDEDQFKKLRTIHGQLHGGTDRERDYGHRLWLLANDIQETEEEVADTAPIEPPFRTEAVQPSAFGNYEFPAIYKMATEKNIRFHLDGCKVHMSQAGILSVVNPVFGQGYYGRFDHNGVFTPTKQCTDKVLDQLKDIEINGVDAAKRIGLLTGCCCVCGRTLTNEGSIEEGIGPICAGKAFGV